MKEESGILEELPKTAIFIRFGIDYDIFAV